MKCLHIAGLALLLGATLGHNSWAAWETITPPRNPDRNCEDSHDKNRFALLKNSDNRPLRVLAGANGDIEIYGHLLDTVTDVSMGGISGASARRAGGHAGAVNGARWCGNIGSIIVNISIPSSTTASNGGTLHVGGEDIPIVVVRGDPRVDWSPYNDSDLLSSETQAQIDANRNSRHRLTVPPTSHSARQKLPSARLIVPSAAHRLKPNGNALQPNAGAATAIA